jgi:hypothetical protein
LLRKFNSAVEEQDLVPASSPAATPTATPAATAKAAASPSATATTATAAEPAAPATGAEAVSLWPRLGYGDRPVAHGFAIDLADRLLSSSVASHFDESEPARLTAVPVGDDGHAAHFARLGEQFSQRSLGDTIRQIADV